MGEKGIDPGGKASKGLNDVPDVEYDAVVTMGCGGERPCVWAKKRPDWSIPDPEGLPIEGFRRIKDVTEEKVTELLSGLERGL